MTPHLQLTTFCSFACRSSWIFFYLLLFTCCFTMLWKKKNTNCFHRLQLVHIKTNFVPYIYLSGNSDYEKLQNCIYYWQWTEKIYLFPLHVLATHRKIQKYFDFIRRSDQFSLIPKPHLETCRLLILCLFFIPQKWDPSVWLLQTRPRHKIWDNHWSRTLDVQLVSHSMIILASCHSKQAGQNNIGLRDDFGTSLFVLILGHYWLINFSEKLLGWPWFKQSHCNFPNF